MDTQQATLGKRKTRTDRGEGSLFKRGRFWTFKAPDGQQYSTLKAQLEIRNREFPECKNVFFWHREDIAISNFIVPLVGKPIGQFQKTWHTAVEAAGYPGLLFRDLRRTAERNFSALCNIDLATSIY